MIIEILLTVIVILLLLNLVISYKATKIGDRSLADEVKFKLDEFNKNLAKIELSIRDEFARNREEINKNFREVREELRNTIKSFEDSLSRRMNDLMQVTEQRLDKMRETVETKLNAIQDDNSKKLERIRETVDEKLHDTLEKRLGESFKIVSERLELVHKGLGEMQNLATGVGDLKKVLTNVKARGVLGEYQLENILEQMLTPEQYAKNQKTKKDSNAIVEFAVKLPGRDDTSKTVWLPIDAKFPTEDYQLLLEAYDRGDLAGIEEHKKSLVNRIKLSAKDIRDKYLDPPNTTDFAIMFLPFEGIYAEILRNAGLFEAIQRDYKVVITGPTTISAFLNSLQMGFRTLAIEKRSSEVWELLGAVKTEFGNFGAILEKTHKKLKEASNVIEQAGVRSRVIERKLRDVQELPEEASKKLLGERIQGNTDEMNEENE